jgi:hypothetical protein
MRLHETKKLLHREGSSYQTEEAAHRMGFASYTSDKGLIPRVYRELKIWDLKVNGCNWRTSC